MIVLVCSRINIERKSKFSISFQTRTFVITFEGLLTVPFASLRCIASSFGLEMLTVTSDEHLVLTRLVLPTGRRSMAGFLARMTARPLAFPT